MLKHCSILLILALPLHSHAESSTQPNYVPPASVISTESMLQMIAGLLLVLAIIGTIAWLLKRFAILPTATSGGIKVIASAGIGQRERIVVIEIENTRLVLGVTQSQINTLHRSEKPTDKPSDDELDHSSNNPFPKCLNQTMEKNHGQ